MEKLLLLSNITVNTLADTIDLDPNVTSLREAITKANGDLGADTINVAPGLSGMIRLTRGQPLTITESVAINGPGASILTVNANNSGGVFAVNSGVTAVTIRGLTLTGGNASSGGAISNAGDLVVADTVIAGNTSYNSGGGVANTGSLTMTNCSLSNNSARHYPGEAFTPNGLAGGGLANFPFARASLVNCTISGNSATGSGGGIANGRGTLTLTNCTIAGNASYAGGGVVNDAGGGPATAAPATLTSCTLSDNSAAGGAFSGGGVRNNGGALTLNNTIVANSTSGYDLATGGSGTLTGSNNLIETFDTVGQLAGTSSADPNLGPLRDNGGPTRTMALLAGSPAINAGLGNALANDQRGAPFVRRSGGAVDIGAYEVQRIRFVVDTVLDGIDGDYSRGQLSLREAVALANANPGPDLISFGLDQPSTITLTKGQALAVTESVAINGPGAANLTVDANNLSGIFAIDAATNAGVVTIDGLTLARGHATYGGAIRNDGNLHVDNTVIRNNTADLIGGGIYNTSSLTVGTSTLSSNMIGGFGYGGAIYNQGGTVYLSDSTLSGNRASSSGGGLESAGGSVTAVGCTFSNNTVSPPDSSAFTVGGGLFIVGGTVDLADCVVSGNSVGLKPGSAGGGLFINAGRATVTNCTLRGNVAPTGGGLMNGADLTVSGTTIDGNSAFAGGGGVYNFGTMKMTGSTVSNSVISGQGSGGGIDNEIRGTATLINCTLANNSVGSGANSAGGGLYNGGNATVTNCTLAFNGAPTAGGLFNIGTLALNNTIVAKSSRGGDFWNVNNAPVTGSNNLIMSAPLGLPPGLKVTYSDDPLFDGGLKLNGGPNKTRTIAIQKASRAVNNGLNTPQTPATDQRGLGRVGNVDIGAFEFQ